MTAFMLRIIADEIQKTLRRYTYGINSGFLLHVTVAALAIILNTHSAFKNGDFVMISSVEKYLREVLT